MFINLEKSGGPKSKKFVPPIRFSDLLRNTLQQLASDMPCVWAILY